MSIVVVGSVAFDTIETPSARVERVIGGSATYFSIAASYFLPVQLVAAVGEDFRAEHHAVLEARGVDLEGLTTIENGKTFYWEGRYGRDPNERDTLVTELNVFDGFKPRLPERYRDSEYLFLANIDPEVQLEVLEQMKGEPFVGCDTMNFWIAGKPDELRNVLRRTDILFINDGEAKQLSGEINIPRAAGTILDMGPGAVVIKKGEHGAFIFTKDFRFYTPAYPLAEVVDPTGAGDSFAGGFMGYLAGSAASDEPHLRRAMLYGTLTAGFTCERFSVERLTALTARDIEGRFQELVDLVRIDLE